MGTQLAVPCSPRQRDRTANPEPVPLTDKTCLAKSWKIVAINRMHLLPSVKIASSAPPGYIWFGLSRKNHLMWTADASHTDFGCYPPWGRRAFLPSTCIPSLIGGGGGKLEVLSVCPLLIKSTGQPWCPRPNCRWINRQVTPHPSPARDG